jgi:transglutaminase-like putative cysteine protease
MLISLNGGGKVLMKKIVWGCLAALLLCAHVAGAENYTLEGRMASTMRYELRDRITSAKGIKKLSLSFVVPATFSSPTYRQEISDFQIVFRPEPETRADRIDHRGNRIIQAAWTAVPEWIDVQLSCLAVNETSLFPLMIHSAFPPTDPGDRFRDYLMATELVQSDDSRIRKLAKDLTGDVTTRFDAVQRVVSWVVDHVRYVNPPERYDAVYSLESGKGNCQNFSHLGAAILRAVGIPVRIVNGVTAKQPFDVKTSTGALTFKMGEGRHSWIEVWFPDLGWIPFDPQNTQLFVSNRFVRIQVGVDNHETENDGLLQWVQLQDAEGNPTFQETMETTFLTDVVEIQGNQCSYGPKNLLLSPDVKAEFKQIAIAPPLPPPVITEAEKKAFRYEIPFIFGNLAFPGDVDFAFPRVTTAMDANRFEMKRNFLVETAEYVTTKRTRYAQIFVLNRPVKLSRVGLALHKFGGDGWLWADIIQDKEGRPGDMLATSDIVDLDALSLKPGYRWADFPFEKDGIILMPGSYWIALGFTGSPVVSWFFTYGKPVGPVEGTRYRGVFDREWSGALGYEFNYRVEGLSVQ